MRIVHLDVSQKSHVIAWIELAEMARRKPVIERGADKLVQVHRIALISEELDGAVIEQR